MRDTAVDGLTRLLGRPEWRASPDGAAIATTIKTALKDDNGLVRMTAAQAASALYADSPPDDRVAAIGELLLDEPDRRVQDVLLNCLSRDAPTHPNEVDSILQQFTATPVNVPTD
jgi:hypothetical protein